MKHYLQYLFLVCFLGTGMPVSWAQPACDLTNYASIYHILPANYPYTSPSSGITISARTTSGISTFTGHASEYCTPGGAYYPAGASSWYINSSTDSIILTFSRPVSNFSLVLTGTDNLEELTISASGGVLSLSNYCSPSFSVNPATPNVLKSSLNNTATLLTINNTIPVTQYVITHNGLASGSLINILDCLNGVNGPSNVYQDIALWLDGSNVNNNPGTNPADATPVGTWKDISGYGNNASVLAGQDTPSLKSVQINGKDVIRFSRTSGNHGTVYEVPNLDIRASVTPQTTIFTVYRQGTFATGELQGIWGNDNSGWDRFFMPVYSGSTTGVVSVGPPLNNVAVPGSGVVGATKLLTTVYDYGKKDSSVIYYNALPLTRTTDSTDPVAAQSALRIGWDGDDNPFNGDIAEMIVYRRKLTECEIKAVNRYFGYKYGVNLTTALITPSTPQYGCPSSPVALKASAGTSFQWLKNGAVIASATDSVYNAGTTGYYAVVISKDGCADTSVPTLVTIVPPIIYVDSSKAVSASGASWDSAKRTLNEALFLANMTSCPVQIWVRKGTYYPTAGTSRDSSFRINRNNIKIYGGFAGTEVALSARSVAANPTILSGDIGASNDSTDNSYHIMTIFAKTGATIDTNTVVDGFTLTGGNGQAAGSYSYNGITYNRQDGAAMELWGAGTSNQCSPLIANCTITRNAANFGGGIYGAGFSGGNASPVLRNNTFSNNKANNLGGAVFNNGQNTGTSSPTIDRCTFSNNTAATGGAVYFQASGSGISNALVLNCSFSSNLATADGGAMGMNNANPKINNSAFTKNTSGYSGGALYQEGGLSTLKNNLFDQNSASIGGAIRIYTGNPSIVLNNNVFYRNVATGNDGGGMSLVSGGGKDTIINNLFVFNKGTGSGPNGGAAFVQEAGVSTYILNNTFYGDTSTSNGAAIRFKDAGTNRYLYNNIFYKNYNGSSTTDYNTATGATVTAAANNLLGTTDPRFVNQLNPAGPDGLWLTADDGLDLLPCSPAVNAATAAAPATDIRNRSRVGLPDIGAYEEQGGTLPLAPVATTPVTYCQNNPSAVALTATRSTATDTLKWYDATSTRLPAAPVPSTTTVGSTTYYVSQTNIGGCESPMTTITVVINATPAAPLVTTPVVYCQGIAASALTATKALTADTLKWYDAVPTALSAAPTPSTTATGSTTYYVSEKTGLGCEGPKAAIVVTVNATPAAPTATSPVVYCQNAGAVALTATPAAAADTLKWYNAVPALLPAAPTPSTATTGSTNYFVSGKNGFGCEGPKKTIVVTINVTPGAPAATTTVTYCQDDVPSALTATKADPTDTLKWYNAGLSLLATAPVPSTLAPGTTIYYVSDKTSLGCEGPKTKITVTVNPKPAAPLVITPIDICVGVTPLPLTATGLNLKWYTAGTGGTGTPVLVPAVSATGATIYYVSQTTALGCEGPRSALTVNVRPSPVVTVAPLRAPAYVYCHNDSITIKATSATATSYQWYRNTITMTGSVNDSLIIKTTADYGVIVKDVYGCADTETVRVIENPLPNPVLFPTNVFICPGVSIMLYATPATSGYNYEWSRNGIPMGIPGTNDHTPVTTAGTYSIKVTDIYNCVLRTNNALVSLYPVMATPELELTGTALRVKTSYATYQWYRNGVLIPGATARSYTILFDGDYSVAVTDANGCMATSDIFKAKGLSIATQIKAGSIKLYPNPTQAQVTIEADLPVNVKVTDLTGRIITEQQQARTINLEAFADGIYIFTITDSNGMPVLIEKVNKISK